MRGRWRKVLGALAAIAVTVAGVALLLRATGGPPAGPAEVAWDRDVCAECRMHVGDPGFAAQLQERDGPVRFFDDPGCLFRWQARHQPHVHRVYFHHLRDERWLPEGETAFVEVDRSPMGYGLGAVDRETADAMSVDAARARVLGRSSSRLEARRDR